MRQRAGFRFRPPTTELSPELRAVLRLAFAPSTPDPGGGDPEAVWELAGKLGLREAMAGHPGEGAPSALAGALGERLRRWRRLSVARDLLHEATARQVGAIAAERDLSIIWLKGFALRQLGVHPPGRRGLQDLDLLASDEDAGILQRLLRERGWHRHGETSNEQHLPPLESPDGCFLDIHFRLRGVRLKGAGWAGADEVLAWPGTRPAEGAESEFLPGRDLLAAHLIVHAVAQHGHRPATYAILRAVHDLSSLLPSEEAWRRFSAAAYTNIAESVSRRELEALASLTSALPAGKIPDAAEQPDAHRLLRHALAGAIDARYARTLRRRHLGGRVREAFSQGHLGAYLRRKLASLRLG